ncbi:MAG: hypothetical protein EOP04_29360 [Proteobacteria bacterium]|nr:MAG: hypothetical protein EOP04_29360 [Pseudomonadota bacterium]
MISVRLRGDPYYDPSSKLADLFGHGRVDLRTHTDENLRKVRELSIRESSSSQLIREPSGLIKD